MAWIQFLVRELRPPQAMGEPLPIKKKKKEFPFGRVEEKGANGP